MMRRAKLAVVSGCVLTLLLCFFDTEGALTVRAPHVAVGLTAVSALIGLLLNRREGRAQLVIVGLLPFAILAIVRFAYWPPRKELLAASDRLGPGMTIAEVRTAMAGVTEGTGWPRLDGGSELSIEGAIVFHGAGQGGDWIVVSFDGGTVSEVRFEPD
jgi:hypothetical protein